MYSNVSVKLIKTYLQQIAAELPYEQKAAVENNTLARNFIIVPPSR